jgi:peptidoglycan/LPS O-acetylase OafA/YrhL
VVEPTPKSARYAYQPALDGIRALAVGSVMLYHASQSWALGGYLGVDAFFVLSGFLITTLLVTEWSSRGAIQLGAFWLRRAKRLLPALVVVILGIVFYAAVFAAPAEMEKIRSDGFATLAYAANWKFIFAGQSYFDQFTQPSPFHHIWSLAIEEQFYLVWPLIVFGVLRLTRSVRALLALAITMMLGSALLMALLYNPGHDPSRVYYGTDTRAQSLLMGAVAGILVFWHGPLRTVVARRVLRVLAFAGAGYTLWLWSSMSENTTALYRGGFLLASLSVVLVIVSVTQPDRGVLGRALSWYPLRWIGMISYGLYLWHWPVYLTMTATRTGLHGTALLFARLAVTFAFASASYYLVERPIRRGNFVVRPAYLVAPSALVLVVALIVSTTTTAATAPAGNTGAARAAPVAAGAAGAAPTTAVAPTKILLVGDSIALSIGNGVTSYATAHPGEIAFLGRASLGCGMLRGGEIEIGLELSEQPGECDDWNTRWLQPLQQMQPDVVVCLVGAWDLLDRKLDGRMYSPGDPEFDRYFLSELDHATQLLGSTGANVVLLTAPYFSRPELVGQTGHAWPEYEPWRVDHVNALFSDFLVSHPGRYTLLDLNRFVSPGGKFTDELGGVSPLRGDGVHFTIEGATYVATQWLVPKLQDVARLQPGTTPDQVPTNPSP